MISSLLHLVGLRPRVYYTLTNFRGGGGKAPLNTPCNLFQCSMIAKKGLTLYNCCAVTANHF